MHAASALATAVLIGASLVSAAPKPWSVPQEHFEVLSLRHATPLNPSVVKDVRCTDTEAHIVFHEQNAAQLAICDGIAGATKTRCTGATGHTVGRRGSAKFSLTALRDGASINIAKTRWEECVRAARDKCPTGSLVGTCVGGATAGDVEFTLESTMFAI